MTCERIQIHDIVQRWQWDKWSAEGKYVFVDIDRERGTNRYKFTMAKATPYRDVEEVSRTFIFGGKGLKVLVTDALEKMFKELYS